MQDTWSHVEFKFTQHKGTDVHLVKMAEEDFEALEDNQVLVQVTHLHTSDTIHNLPNQWTSWAVQSMLGILPLPFAACACATDNLVQGKGLSRPPNLLVLTLSCPDTGHDGKPLHEHLP